MFGRRRDCHFVGSDSSDLRACENVNIMDGYYDYRYIEGRYPGLWELQMYIFYVTFHGHVGERLYAKRRIREEATVVE